MDLRLRLRPRARARARDDNIFTKAEIEKMEKLLNESSQKVLNEDLYKSIARRFCCSSGRAGKPVVKWNQVQTWFETRKQQPLDCSKIPQEDKSIDITELEFEARSSKDGAWYDVDVFIAHRFLSTGEPEARVRYLGFGAEEDEWVDIKRAVRERSIALEPNECHKVKVGDLVLCFQERRDGASHFDAHVLEIQRRMHDIRGCRCVFLIRYDHDDSQERVLLKRLCRRPTH